MTKTPPTDKPRELSGTVLEQIDRFLHRVADHGSHEHSDHAYKIIDSPAYHALRSSSTPAQHQEDLWVAVRLMAEGSDWKRDQGETLTAWAQRKLIHERREDVEGRVKVNVPVCPNCKFAFGATDGPVTSAREVEK